MGSVYSRLSVVAGLCFLRLFGLSVHPLRRKHMNREEVNNSKGNNNDWDSNRKLYFDEIINTVGEPIRSLLSNTASYKPLYTMLALRQAAISSLRRSTPRFSAAAAVRPMATSAFHSASVTVNPCRSYHDDAGIIVGPYSGNGMLSLSSTVPFTATTNTCATNSVSLSFTPLTSLASLPSLPSSLSTLWDWVQESVWHMSSTLKKRRAKMNKHKLRKRRKKNRKKTKKV